MQGKKFAEFVQKKLSEKGEEIPEIVQRSAEALEQFEEAYGTDTTIEFIEKICMEEMQKDESGDPGYSEFLLNFLHEMKRDAAAQKSN